MHKHEAEKLLPSVGSKVSKALTGSRTLTGTVIYVNRPHLWYLVEFEISNDVKIRQGYKIF